MDPNRIERHLASKIEHIQRDIDAETRKDYEPIEIYDRQFFRANIPFGDAIIQAKVITCFERLVARTENGYVDSYGPWIIFRVEDVLSGDSEGMIDIGAAIMARWNSQQKTYLKYLYKSDPKVSDWQITKMAVLSHSTTEEEIVKASI